MYMSAYHGRLSRHAVCCNLALACMGTCGTVIRLVIPYLLSYVPDMLLQCHEAALRREFVWRACKIKGEPTFECQDHGPL